MKRLTLIFVLALLLATSVSGCGSSANQAALKDPATVLQENGFTQIPAGDECNSPCTKYELAYGSHWDVLVFANGTFDLFVSYETYYNSKPPFDQLQKILAGAFPLSIVNKIMSNVKASKDRNGTVANYDWMVTVINPSGLKATVNIGIKPH